MKKPQPKTFREILISRRAIARRTDQAIRIKALAWAHDSAEIIAEIRGAKYFQNSQRS